MRPSSYHYKYTPPPVLDTHDLGLDKKTKRASAVCQKLLLEIKYICIIVMYEWQASLFDNDNLLKEQKTVFGRKTGVRNKNQLSKNLPVVENITC